VPTPTGTATVKSLLAEAESSFAAGTTALRAGNLAEYQADNNQAELYVAQATALEGKSSGG
jgi:hypothetical protein